MHTQACGRFLKHPIALLEPADGAMDGDASGNGPDASVASLATAAGASEESERAEATGTAAVDVADASDGAVDAPLSTAPEVAPNGAAADAAQAESGPGAVAALISNADALALVASMNAGVVLADEVN